ncbi:HAD hydrolase-like protein, partial [candidate division KSB3 bacterium]|nr:HAD hydrolase-like protein [candidate division KSB3 bacterium]MBD3326168.1 HAD hydrolase-like protein [candidate division KSB3 bacterium]
VKVLVFDFDGTLVQSNRLKYEAFFALFPRDERHGSLVRDVLADHLEESRYTILAEVLRRRGDPEAEIEQKVAKLAAAYNDLVVQGAKTCPECPGAEQTLRQLHGRYPLYLSSTTPETALREILRFRGWDRYFKAIFGYPRHKSGTLREIIRRECMRPEQVLVVGDGESDERSAQDVGCRFFDVKDSSLSCVWDYL